MNVYEWLMIKVFRCVTLKRHLSAMSTLLDVQKTCQAIFAKNLKAISEEQRDELLKHREEVRKLNDKVAHAQDVASSYFRAEGVLWKNAVRRLIYLIGNPDFIPPTDKVADCGIKVNGPAVQETCNNTKRINIAASVEITQYELDTLGMVPIELMVEEMTNRFRKLVLTAFHDSSILKVNPNEQRKSSQVSEGLPGAGGEQASQTAPTANPKAPTTGEEEATNAGKVPPTGSNPVQRDL